jgi:hypothetical protein
MYKLRQPSIEPKRSTPLQGYSPDDWSARPIASNASIKSCSRKKGKPPRNRSSAAQRKRLPRASIHETEPKIWVLICSTWVLICSNCTVPEQLLGGSINQLLKAVRFRGFVDQNTPSKALLVSRVFDLSFNGTTLFISTRKREGSTARYSGSSMCSNPTRRASWALPSSHSQLPVRQCDRDPFVLQGRSMPMRTDPSFLALVAAWPSMGAKLSCTASSALSMR